MKDFQFEIHPFNEVFYIETLLNKTHSVFHDDFESLNNIWKNGNHHCKYDDVILDLFSKYHS